MNKIVHDFKVTCVFLYSKSKVKRTTDRGIALCDYTQVLTLRDQDISHQPQRQHKYQH